MSLVVGEPTSFVFDRRRRNISLLLAVDDDAGRDVAVVGEDGLGGHRLSSFHVVKRFSVFILEFFLLLLLLLSFSS